MTKLIDVLVNAAAEASSDLGDQTLPLDDVTDRNEARISSYVGVRLNDLLRNTHHDPLGIFVTHEPRVSWMDDLTGTPVPFEGALKPAQRFDLATWDHEQITGLIEIKNAPGMDRNRALSDVIRLREALTRWGPSANGTLKWGAYLFSLRLRRAKLHLGKGELKRLFDERVASIGTTGDGQPTRTMFHMVDKGPNCCLAWCAVGFGEI